jgi:hypothetical protein
MIQQHPFLGGMDLDSPAHVIPRGLTQEARNIIYRGQRGNMRAESNVGTTLVPNSYLPGSGVNLTISAYYDAVKHRVFFWNYNSLGTHGIYIYWTLTGTFQRCIVNGYNTTGDPLGFTSTRRINSVDIIYGDTYDPVQDQGGDLVFYIDSLGRPTKFNVDRILAGVYPSIKRDYIEVIKAPPSMPPQCVYENDTTVLQNNLNGCIFQFAVSYYYDDYERSVISGASKIPLPSSIYNLLDQIDVQSNNARISVFFQTGDINVKKIRLYGKKTQNGVTTDWFVIDDINKATAGAASNSIYRYVFYNNGTYVTEDPTYTVLPYDFVPIQANCQTLLNGSNLAYAGITEGYDYVNSNIQASSTLVPKETILNNGFLLFGYQTISNSVGTAGDNITFYVGGCGINDPATNLLKTIVLGSPLPVISVTAILANGTDVSFTVQCYPTAISDPVLGFLYHLDVATLFTEFSSAATTAGFTVVSTTANSITIQKTNAILLASYATLLNSNIYIEQNNFGRFAHLPNASYQYGIKYYDAYGRTNGVITNVGAVTTTPQVAPPPNPNTTGNWVKITYPVGQVHYFIDGGSLGFFDYTPQPPPYPSTVAYASLTKVANGPADFAIYLNTNYFGWYGGVQPTGNSSTITGAPSSAGGGINDTIPKVTVNLAGFTPPSWAAYYHVVRTDNNTYGKYVNWITKQAFSNANQLAANQYAYLDITNMQDYNQTINASSQAASNNVSYQFSQGDRVNITGIYAVNGNFTQLDYDYAIIGLVVDPVINGIAQTGNYLQIAYPAADIANNASLKFDGSDDFQNYQITIYSYKQTETATQEVYYEVGERYGIINAGTNSAQHAGNNGVNSVILTEADFYFRIRQVPCGNTYYLYGGPEGWDALGNGQYIVGKLDHVAPTSTVVGNIVTANFQIQKEPNVANASLTATTAPGIGDTWFFKNTSVNPLTCRLRASIPVTVTGACSFGFHVKIISGTGVGTVTPISILQYSGGLSALSAQQIEIDGTFNVPGGGECFLIYANNTDSTVNAAVKISQYVLRLDVIRNIGISVFDKSYSDIYTLITNADNRPAIQDTSALQSDYNTLFRFGRSFEQGTIINDSNRFYPNDVDEFNKSFGAVKRMTINLKQVIIWQERRIGRINVYAKLIQDNKGASNLTTTDTIITPNNIQYYEGEYGIANQPDCIASYGYQHYFVDPVKGYICRLSVDGIVPLSELYKVQIFTGQNLPKYLNSHPYTYGGNAVILACYNFLSDRDSEVVFTFQESTDNAGLASESLAFVESRNMFQSFYDYTADALVCAENQLFTFRGGNMYALKNNSTYCNYYSSQFAPSVTVPYNDNVLQRKTWIGVSEESNVIWNCPSIVTQTTSYGSTQQQSKLVDANFALLEGKYEAAFMKDINSQGGWLNGSSLKGGYIVIKFQPTNGANFSYLMPPMLRYIDSPLNVR